MSGPNSPPGEGRMPPAGKRPDSSPGLVTVEQPGQDNRSEVLRVVAEQLRIEKRLVEGEGVRIRLVADEEATPANVTLRTERIEVDRVPIGRVVQSAPAVREEDGVTIIPVMEEVVVTETRLVLKEELHVRRVVDTREHQQTILLQRQRAEVERLPATGKPITKVETPTSTKDDKR